MKFADVALVTSPFYMAVLVLLYLFLAFNIIRLRWRYKVALKDGGKEDLTRAIRAHGNFAEYAPLTMLLIALCEINAADLWLIHTLGITFILARIVHALSLYKSILKARTVGMTLTFFTLFMSAAVLVYSVFA